MSRRPASRFRLWTCATLMVATSLLACNWLTTADEFEIVDDVGVDSATPPPSDSPLNQFDARPPPTDSSGADHYTLSPDAQTKRVFVTSGYWFSYDVGGVAGANAKCIEAAKAAKLGDGNWVAWLSTKDKNAKDKLPTDVAYVLVDGTTVVATNLQELTSGSLLNAIALTEYGAGVGPTLQDTAVWTGTKPDGTLAEPEVVKNCNEFPDVPAGTIPGTGVVGSCWQKTGQWTDILPQSCVTWPGRFYCFEL